MIKFATCYKNHIIIVQKLIAVADTSPVESKEDAAKESVVWIRPTAL
ncbi:MAG: hypothetical protein PHP48_05620 [Bacteroidales bacterium]|nr:hypothetical protein [Bacteroidales bacterium]